MTITRFLPLALLALAFTGCTSITVTNLTPRQLPRNANGIYFFEAALESNQQTLRTGSIKPYVLVGFDSYPMEPAHMLTNRWEALVPIAADKKFVPYRFKFDFDYNRFGDRGKSSRLSQQYQLEITEKE